MGKKSLVSWVRCDVVLMNSSRASMANFAILRPVANREGWARNSHGELPGARYRRPQCSNRLERLLEPDTKSPLSTRSTLYPRAANSCAPAAPLIPPPTIATSKTSPFRRSMSTRSLMPVAPQEREQPIDRLLAARPIQPVRDRGSRSTGVGREKFGGDLRLGILAFA